MKQLDTLIEGYKNFRNTGWSAERERWQEMSEGQSPTVMVIACSDSRVDPAQIFDTRPGEVFVVRNVAALVPPFETSPGYHGVSAAVEFAVTQLKVEAILVMGHGCCGGCQASLHGLFDKSRLGEGGFIAHWVDMLDGARDNVRSKYDDIESLEAITAMEQEAVKVSMTNLRSFGFVRHAEQSGQLAIYGAHFAIEHGELWMLDEQKGEFMAVK